MYSNTGYLYQHDTEIKDTTHELTVTGCGIYRLLTRTSMDTLRSNGRKDYQLLYIGAGRAFFHMGGELLEAPTGSMVLYRPGVPQHYVYYLEDKPEVYWVHFSGTRAADWDRRMGFPKSGILPAGNSSEYHLLFSHMIQELQVPRPCMEDVISLDLQQVFLKIMRYTQEPHANHQIRHEVQEAVHYFNEHFADAISIEDYAAAQHLSTCWFIRSFRRYIGVPPMQYLTSLRIQKARKLLEDTDYPIAEISAMTGYENPLYFSRLFRRVTGYAPSEYRRLS
ncbi:MAG: helix-turn-helix domain-containing protein [Lachnospiraceae bacterium]|nr:helix-turn-helix domain-containing protein [Lachnospiraceae bacterium]